MTRGERNFSAWKKSMGFDASFPRLAPLPDDELQGALFVDLHLGSVMRDLIVSRGRRHAVVVPEGQGATTLARRFHADLDSSAILLQTIPVLVEFDKMVDARPADFNELVHEEILRSICTRDWEHVVGRSAYADMVGANTASDVGIERVRGAFRGIRDFRALPSEAVPYARIFKSTLPELLATLRNNGIKVQLVVDLSAGSLAHRDTTSPNSPESARSSTEVKSCRVVFGDRLSDFFSSLEVDEISFRVKTVVPTYFGPPTMTGAIGSLSNFGEDVTRVAQLRPIDLFEILRRQHDDKLTGRPVQEIASVFHNDLLVPFMKDGEPIDVTLSALESWLVNDAFDRERPPIELRPDDLLQRGIQFPPERRDAEMIALVGRLQRDHFRDAAQDIGLGLDGPGL